jgi:hypothetical protein
LKINIIYKTLNFWIYSFLLNIVGNKKSGLIEVKFVRERTYAECFFESKSTGKLYKKIKRANDLAYNFKSLKKRQSNFLWIRDADL